jgi:predicted kinase
MPLLTATVGEQGSGKTTWALAEVAKFPPGIVGRVNRDQLRIMSHGGYKGTFNHEYQITMAQNALVVAYLGSGMDVIVDDTNMRGEESLDRWIEISRSVGALLHIVDFLDVPFEECLRRNHMRAKWERVPQSAMYQTWYGLHDAMFPDRGMDDPYHKDSEIIAEFRNLVRRKGLSSTIMM